MCIIILKYILTSYYKSVPRIMVDLFEWNVKCWSQIDSMYHLLYAINHILLNTVTFNI